LYKTFSKATTSKFGKVTILIVWFVFSILAIWASTNVDIDFKNTYFISADASINNYLDKTDVYYKSGETVYVIVDNKDIDYTSETSQKALEDFNEKLKACDGCS
jgi:predicted RND superfamily exporter protein